MVGLLSLFRLGIGYFSRSVSIKKIMMAAMAARMMPRQWIGAVILVRADMINGPTLLIYRRARRIKMYAMIRVGLFIMLLLMISGQRYEDFWRIHVRIIKKVVKEVTKLE